MAFEGTRPGGTSVPHTLGDESLRLALAAANIGAWSWRADEDVLEWDELSYDLLGVPRDAPATRERFREAIHPDDLLRVEQAVAAARERGEAYAVETRVNIADGPPRHIQVRGTVVLDPAGEVQGIHGVIIDITRRRQSQDDLENSERRFRRAMEISPIGVVIVDGAGRIEYANPALHRMLEYEIPALSGTSVRDVTFPDDRAATRDALRRVLRGSLRSATLEKRYVTQDQKIRWGRVHVTVVPMGPDGELRLLGFIDDITEQKQRESEARDLERKVRRASKLESLGVLAGGIAHDFNNLLVGVLGHAGLARSKLAHDAAARENVEQIELAATRASELTNQLLAYSGGGRLELRPVDLSGIVSEMQSLLDVAVPPIVELVLDVDPELPSVEGDEVQLRQVVMNLITNAAEAFDGGAGRVTLRTRPCVIGAESIPDAVLNRTLQPGAYVTVEVRDDGPGIPAEVMERIFDPFFTTKRSGRGLGLAAVLGIVRSHGGDIQIQSNPETGTAVRVLLPAAADARVAASAPPPTEPVASPVGLRVLLADDQAMVRRVAGEMLGCVGHEVVEAFDGEEAVRVFAEDPASFDLVLLDVTMPRLSGVEALQAIRELRPDIPAIVSSGHAEEAALETLKDGEPAVFVKKPYRIADLLSAVALALADE